jgi:hypothetical protein
MIPIKPPISTVELTGDEIVAMLEEYLKRLGQVSTSSIVRRLQRLKLERTTNNS